MNYIPSRETSSLSLNHLAFLFFLVPPRRILLDCLSNSCHPLLNSNNQILRNLLLIECYHPSLVHHLLLLLHRSLILLVFYLLHRKVLSQQVSSYFRIRSSIMFSTLLAATLLRWISHSTCSLKPKKPHRKKDLHRIFSRKSQNRISSLQRRI